MPRHMFLIKTIVIAVWYVLLELVDAFWHDQIIAWLPERLMRCLIGAAAGLAILAVFLLIGNTIYYQIIRHRKDKQWFI